MKKPKPADRETCPTVSEPDWASMSFDEQCEARSKLFAEALREVRVRAAAEADEQERQRIAREAK